MHTIFWTGFSNKTRIAAMGEIETVIRKYGFITDSKLFSDVSVSLKIEVNERRIDELHNALNELLTLNDIDKLNSLSDAERVIFLNITFLKATGYLRIEAPAIPG
jgi:hypothetical protein